MQVRPCPDKDSEGEKKKETDEDAASLRLEAELHSPLCFVSFRSHPRLHPFLRVETEQGLVSKKVGQAKLWPAADCKEGRGRAKSPGE